jgi:hypothetical protein
VSYPITFTLEMDEDGDWLFADSEGAMYGLGHSIGEAVQDWEASAAELRTHLRAHDGTLHPQVAERLAVLDRLADLKLTERAT